MLEWDDYQNADFQDYYGPMGLWPVQPECHNEQEKFPVNYYRRLNWYYSEQKRLFYDDDVYYYLEDRARYYWWKAQYWRAKYAGDEEYAGKCRERMSDFL